MITRSGVHLVAYACRDREATRHFYEDLFGFPLVHMEVTTVPDRESFFRHLFFDLGDGSSIAFFDLHEMGEKTNWRSDVSTGNGLPVWVNHIAFMDVDHGLCHSHYYLDPNRIMVEFCRDTPGFAPDPTASREALH